MKFGLLLNDVEQIKKKREIFEKMYNEGFNLVNSIRKQFVINKLGSIFNGILGVGGGSGGDVVVVVGQVGVGVGGVGVIGVLGGVMQLVMVVVSVVFEVVKKQQLVVGCMVGFGVVNNSQFLQ